jgi:hypothetical protein
VCVGGGGNRERTCVCEREGETERGGGGGEGETVTGGYRKLEGDVVAPHRPFYTHQYYDMHVHSNTGTKNQVES